MTAQLDGQVTQSVAKKKIEDVFSEVASYRLYK